MVYNLRLITSYIVVDFDYVYSLKTTTWNNLNSLVFLAKNIKLCFFIYAWYVYKCFTTILKRLINDLYVLTDISLKGYILQTNLFNCKKNMLSINRLII